MIKSFASKLAEDIYNGVNSRQSRQFSPELHSKAQRLLDQLNAITVVETLRIPPSNRLEKLKGNLAGYFSLRINKQWRIIFRWHQFDAYQVDIVDYH
jgi:Plasmid maintenance system killer protein